MVLSNKSVFNRYECTFQDTYQPRFHGLSSCRLQERDPGNEVDKWPKDENRRDPGNEVDHLRVCHNLSGRLGRCHTDSMTIP